METTSTKQELVLTVKTLRLQGRSIRNIAKILHKSPTTIQRYISHNFTEKCWKRDRESRLDAFKDEIETMINESLRWRKQAMNRKIAHSKFCERHPEVSIGYEAFNNFVKEKCELKTDRGLARTPEAHDYGEAQIDFHDEVYFKHGRRINGHGFTMSFPSSNACFTLLYPAENTQCLTDALVTCFHYLGFVPPVIVFDNASTAVASIGHGRERKMTPKYQKLAAHYGFTPVFCNPASGWEKGNVEVNNKSMRSKYFSPPPHIDNEQSFNQSLLSRCMEDIQTRTHYRLRVPIAELFERDKEAGLPLPKTRFDCRDFRERTTDNCALLQIDKVFYSTSDKHKQKRVRVFIGAFTVEIFDEYGNHIWTHERSYDAGRRVIAKDAYRDAISLRPNTRIADGEQEYLNGVRMHDKPKILQEIAESENIPIRVDSASINTTLFNLRAYNVNWRKYEGLINEHRRPLQKTKIGNSVP